MSMARPETRHLKRSQSSSFREQAKHREPAKHYGWQREPGNDLEESQDVHGTYLLVILL